MSGPIGFVKLCLTLFYTLGLLYWVGLGNIQPTQILLYWVQQAEHRLHREVAGMIYSKFKIFYPGFCNLPSSLRGRFYFTGPTHSQMDFKLQTTTHSGRTIFQCTQPHGVWVDE